MKKVFIGVACAKGILKTLGIAINENVGPNIQQNRSNSEAKYYVQAGAYSQKENAEKQLQKVKDSGFSCACATRRRKEVA